MFLSNIPLEPHVRRNKNGIPFWVLVPLPSPKELELLSLGSKPCNNIKSYIGENRPQILKKIDNNNTYKIFYKIPTTFSLNIVSFVYLKRQEGTSLFNCCSNSSHSLSRILLYFWNSSAMIKCCIMP